MLEKLEKYEQETIRLTKSSPQPPCSAEQMKQQAQWLHEEAMKERESAGDAKKG